MKATFVLLANNDTENYARKLMLKAHKIAGMGFEMSRLPHHVSLKQPFIIKDLEEIEEFFDTFAKSLTPIKVKFENMVAWPSSVFGYESGVLVLQAEKSIEINAIQERLNKELDERFGACPAEHDDDYTFHMTITIGGSSFSTYEKALIDLGKVESAFEAEFNELGLLYYDDDSFKPGTYCCYKRVSLQEGKNSITSIYTT
jgi:2'-5' RNA ligase